MTLNNNNIWLHYLKADIILPNLYYYLYYWYHSLNKLILSFKPLTNQTFAKVMAMNYQLSIDKLLYKTWL